MPPHRPDLQDQPASLPLNRDRASEDKICQVNLDDIQNAVEYWQSKNHGEQERGSRTVGSHETSLTGSELSNISGSRFVLWCL